MADGQEWVLPKPRVRFLRGDGPRGFRVILTGPTDDYQAAYDHLQACVEFQEGMSRLPDEEAEKLWDERPEMGLMGAQLRVAHALLAANYDLTPDEADQLVQLSNDPDNDPEAFQLRVDVLAVARGEAPKPRAGT